MNNLTGCPEAPLGGSVSCKSQPVGGVEGVITEDDIRSLFPPEGMCCASCQQRYYFDDELDEHKLCANCWNEQMKEVPYTLNDLLGAA